MSLKPLFVSTATIKKYGVIENNVDYKLIAQTIIMVQDLQLQQILGSDLYNEIADQINASTLTGLNQTLLDDYIRDFIINATIADGAIIFNYRFSNKGIVTQNSDNQQPVSQRELELIEQKWGRMAEFYGKRLSGYLMEFNTSYPLWMSGNNNAQDIQSRELGYNTGIYLGRSRRKTTNNNERKYWPYCKDC
jgi:hypothetical protein